MDENHQDKTENKLTATEDKATPSSSSLQDQRGTDQLQNNQMEETIKQLRGRGYIVTEEYSNTGQLSKVSGEHPQRKSVWDWLQLLVIPLLIFFLGIGFTWVQNQTSLQIGKDNRAQDLQIAKDTQEEGTLKAYLDDMSDLVLNHNLLKSKPGDEVSQVARERTLTTLRRLKAERNQIVLQFLQDSHLIGRYNTVIDLSGAVLSGDNLDGADLYSTDLSGADLRGAHLGGADLRGAHLGGAHLDHTDLTDAHLGGADLTDAYLKTAVLIGADLTDAHLSCADLTGAHLDLAYLERADLTGAHLGGADLTGAHLYNTDLTGAHLDHADLERADLTGAYLSGADLERADLTGTNIRQYQLDQVSSCKGAILPKGLTCHNLTLPSG